MESPAPGLGLMLGRHVVLLIISFKGHRTMGTGGTAALASRPGSPERLGSSPVSIIRGSGSGPRARDHRGLLSAGSSASLCPLFLPLGPPLIPLLLQTPNSAFPHLCAFAQAALLPPVNPGFSFTTLQSAPSSHWLPQDPPATWQGPLGSEPLAVDTLEDGRGCTPHHHHTR